jgi:hypothetical protein
MEAWPDAVLALNAPLKTARKIIPWKKSLIFFILPPMTIILDIIRTFAYAGKKA